MKKIMVLLLAVLCITGIAFSVKLNGDLKETRETIEAMELENFQLQAEVDELNQMITDLHIQNKQSEDQIEELAQESDNFELLAREYIDKYFEKCEEIELIEEIVKENDTLLDDFTVECFFRRIGIRLINLHCSDEVWEAASNRLILMHENAFYLIENGANMKEVKVYISGVVNSINEVLVENGSEKKLEEIDSLYALNTCLYENQYADWEKVLTTATR